MSKKTAKTRVATTRCGCNNTLARLGVERINSMYASGHGHSKHAAQRNERMTARAENRSADYAAAYNDQIYSSSTHDRYEQAWRQYSDWESSYRSNSNKYQKAVNMYEIAQYGKWMEDHHYSASTIKTSISAICKVAGNGSSIKDFKDGQYGWVPPKRSSSEYKNNRDYDSNSNRYNADNYSDAIALGKATGLRASELTHLHGNNLIQKDDKYYVEVKRGKGGKDSFREVVGTPDQIRRVVDLMQSAGDDTVVSHLPSHFGEHHFRAEYAAAIYNEYSRPQSVLESIAESDPYNKSIIITRVDRPGVPAGSVFDRSAAEKVAHELGHGTQRAATFLSSYAYLCN